MKDSQKKQKKGILGIPFGFFFIGLIIGSIFTGVILNKYNITKEVIIEVEKEQPMILVEFDSWGENINDSSETIFSYFVFNFGNIEAKNVTIICEVSDINDNILKEQFFNIGNIASNSYEYQESYMDYYGNSFEEFGICKLKSVNGEYINLIDRLNDI